MIAHYTENEREREIPYLQSSNMTSWVSFVIILKKHSGKKNEKNKTTKTETETKGRDAELNFDECGGRLKG